MSLWLNKGEDCDRGNYFSIPFVSLRCHFIYLRTRIYLTLMAAFLFVCQIQEKKVRQLWYPIVRIHLAIIAAFFILFMLSKSFSKTIMKLYNIFTIPISRRNHENNGHWFVCGNLRFFFFFWELQFLFCFVCHLIVFYFLLSLFSCLCLCLVLFVVCLALICFTAFVSFSIV